MNHTVKDRFLKYVQIDTQADPFSDTVPSTVKQLNLCRELSKELDCLLYTSPSPRDQRGSRMPSSA